MPRYITIPPEVTLVNTATGRRLKRQTDAFDDTGNACTRCGETKSVILENDPPYSMIRWLESFILADQKLMVRTEEKNGREVQTAEGVKTLKVISAIRKAFRNKSVGDEVLLDAPYWERIREILEKPGNVWNMSQMSQFEPFFEAWAAATDEPAAEKTRKLAAAAVPEPMNIDSAPTTTASA